MNGFRGMKCRMFLHEADGGGWVPYKTLIGPAVGNRVIIGSRGTALYTDTAYETREEAVKAAAERAREVINAHGWEADLIPMEIISEPGATMIEATVVG
jgi:hypothetical protein